MIFNERMFGFAYASLAEALCSHDVDAALTMYDTIDAMLEANGGRPRRYCDCGARLA